MDEQAIQGLGINSLVLMENAARSVYEALLDLLSPQSRLFVLCGPGNNGGDGYALGRIAADNGIEVFCVPFLEPSSADCKQNYKLFAHFGKILPFAEFASQASELKGEDLLVDAIFGTGLEREISGELADRLRFVEGLDLRKLAIDMPTGINGSTGELMGVGLKADFTLALGTEKIGHHLFPGKENRGELLLKKISIPENFPPESAPTYLIDRVMAKGLLKDREKATYKNRQGHLLVLAGNRGMMGACAMAGESGLRSGAGLVTALVPSGEESALLHACPELMTLDRDQAQPEDLRRYQVLLAGCGIGRQKEEWQRLEPLIRSFAGPILLDADAFYGMSGLDGLDPSKLVITPHQGEFLELTGFSPPKDNGERMAQGFAFVKDHPCYLILKGAPTLIFTPQGELYVNSTGNPGMATAGSGDVLAGLVAGLMAQGYSPKEASLLGVYLHGLSGDLFVQRASEETLIAMDLARRLGEAFHSLRYLAPDEY